jgi:pimeloyl-ACP methyl ester carboxylesterase
MGFFNLRGIRQIYLYGHKNPEAISPDNWNMDSRFMERPDAKRIQTDLFYDYRNNVETYPKWQEFLRHHQPKTLIFCGQNDIIFSREGAEAYLKDLPSAEIHRLDTGHFAAEDCLAEIATGIHKFYPEKV